ncbi:sugar phosphate isomerase/epimerase family protein [Rathayibacter sp. VKM Ac-2630]|jgi:sugar phosphate isomerase/epimerase|uniref:sugar phosphate isomerase/epimerase family protein n=1 Tax=Rathayibacter sp. VKM Ac-2630 TaxID=1938617 RepID=UPI0009825B74|nr:sugar phosphate isomerase/epimerase family protein [Rathayibacter sp. VKM Ac-2630]OOB91367.1 xylose isomerase [Rathayibacter sp. VKM Ac-2630]
MTALDPVLRADATTVHPRLSLNQATIKYADLREALDVTARAGYSSIGLWREPVAEAGVAEAMRLVAESGLRVSSLCRGGFFTVPEGPDRRAALDENRRAVDEASALGAPALVLVAGGLPAGSRDLVGARARVSEALAELADYARGSGVQLAIEPLHPMYASDRAVVSTLGQALDLAAPFEAAAVGVVVDTFHVWWDPQVVPQILRAGAEGRIASYQVCDWATPLAADVLLSRHYVGEGVIDFGLLTRTVVEAGYTGDIEVEIFHQEVWDTAYADVAAKVAAGFAEHVAPHL